MLIDKLREELKKSILNKEVNRKTLIRVIIGEAESESKKKNVEINDNMITSILKMMMDNAKQMDNQEEVDIINDFMPRLLTEEEITSEIDAVIEKEGYSTMKDLGFVMKYMKNKFGSTYDGKIASSIAKSKLGFDGLKIKE